jgi:hypothetical protein
MPTKQCSGSLLSLSYFWILHRSFFSSPSDHLVCNLHKMALPSVRVLKFFVKISQPPCLKLLRVQNPYQICFERGLLSCDVKCYMKQYVTIYLPICCFFMGSITSKKVFSLFYLMKSDPPNCLIRYTNRYIGDNWWYIDDNGDR